MILGITDLKKGTIFQLGDEPFRVVSYNQKVMGRGGSIVNVRIKSLIDGKVRDRTFKGNEQIIMADIINQSADFLYENNQVYYFMDNKTFEQFEINEQLIKDKVSFIKAGDPVQIQLFNGRPITIELPKNVNLRVVYTETAVKGDTSSAISKNATLETGLIIKVPAFIKINDIISVDTTTTEYRERVKS